MPAVTFASEKLAQPLTVQGEPGQRLIDVVRDQVAAGKLPMAWRCGQGTCGACVVRLLHEGQPRPVQLGGIERNVLIRAGLMAPSAPRTLPDSPELPRLACHIVLEREIFVYF
ncbi:2Fe-2S iron-sulfur cluster-binding protein [Silvimonas soli]|uniref:2Fe-2S iron-sulfur cluster-binding protein n=1 Tax=Silvimonas soli TaxID=2980100 RepID=UPI0024B31FF2|nr:2Fe-2S iron-sulfur cluster-binding protein [Silvimonas soli]